jgi:SAM-dependent methyltransferase
MDAVLAECSLSVMVNADQVLEECHRVLKARGSLIISDIYARNPEGIADLHCLSLGTCLRGAKSQQGVISQLQAHGFEIMLWEDHSGVLRHLTAQLIMSHSSIEQFWCQMSSGTVDPVEIRVAITRARPGYYLLIASKTPQRSTFFLTQRCEKPELDVGGNGG